MDDGHVGRAAVCLQGFKPPEPPHAVDRLESSGRHEPGTRIGGNAVPRPLLERRPEPVVHGFLVPVEPTQQAEQLCGHPARNRPNSLGPRPPPPIHPRPPPPHTAPPTHDFPPPP